MGLFGFAAPLVVPVDQLLSFPVHVGDETEELVLSVIEGNGLKGKHVSKMRLLQLFPYGDIAIGLPLLCRALGIGGKTDFSPLAGDPSLPIMDGIPFVCLTDRFLELGRDIRTDGELDPAEAFMELPLLASDISSCW
jgi:hypothetical protein